MSYRLRSERRSQAPLSPIGASDQFIARSCASLGTWTTITWCASTLSLLINRPTRSTERSSECGATTAASAPLTFIRRERLNDRSRRRDVGHAFEQQITRCERLFHGRRLLASSRSARCFSLPKTTAGASPHPAAVCADGWGGRECRPLPSDLLNSFPVQSEVE